MSTVTETCGIFSVTETCGILGKMNPLLHGRIDKYRYCKLEYRKNGRYHREDGPAIEYDGQWYMLNRWYLNGKEYKTILWFARILAKSRGFIFPHSDKNILLDWLYDNHFYVVHEALEKEIRREKGVIYL